MEFGALVLEVVTVVYDRNNDKHTLAVLGEHVVVQIGGDSAVM